MTLIRSKQIKRMLLAYIRANGVSLNGGSTVVTSAITTAASSGGDLGSSVPVQVATYSASVQTQGFITSGADNRVQIWSNATKKKIDDGDGGEVYGELTEAGGVYTVTFYKASGAAYSFSGSTSCDLEVPYQYDFDKIPRNALIAIQARNVDDDADAGSGRYVQELINPTGTNTLPNLNKTPIDGTIRLSVNGQQIDILSGSGVTNVGKVLTWAAATVGYSVETTDRVVAQYNTYE